MNLYVSIKILVGDHCSSESLFGRLGSAGLCPHDLYSAILRDDGADGLCDCIVTYAGGIVRIPKYYASELGRPAGVFTNSFAHP